MRGSILQPGHLPLTAQRVQEFQRILAMLDLIHKLNVWDSPPIGKYRKRELHLG